MDLLCITRQLDNDLFLLIGWRFDAIIEDQINRSYETLLSDILLFTVLYLLITELVNALVVKNLKSVNHSLLKIIEGDLDEKVDVHNSIEFVHLSDDINQTVSTLKGYINESEHRMEQELKMAATIQEAVLPHVFKYPRDDFEIFALMKPARQVGGDFYDFFFIDADVLALVIADVSGKGIPAAMFMMRAKAAIGNAARTGISTDKILTDVNNFLCEGNEAEMFVSVWIGIIDLNTGVMQCSNAGHEYPVIYRAGGEYELLKDKHTLVLAAMEDAPVASYELNFHEGDRLFVYTDGAPEAINRKYEPYGTERIVAKLNTLKDASEEQTLRAVHHDIENFVNGAEQFDDITMMGFTFIGSVSDQSDKTDSNESYNDA
jgi:serine phosphatase RsbU (regulator of sigma subunit)